MFGVRISSSTSCSNWPPETPGSHPRSPPHAGRSKVATLPQAGHLDLRRRPTTPDRPRCYRELRLDLSLWISFNVSAENRYLIPHAGQVPQALLSARTVGADLPGSTSFQTMNALHSGARQPNPICRYIYVNGLLQGSISGSFFALRPKRVPGREGAVRLTPVHSYPPLASLRSSTPHITGLSHRHTLFATDP